MHLSIIHKHVPNVCLTSRKRLLIVLIPYWQRSPNDFIPCVNAYQRVKRASNVRSTCMWRVSTVFNECVAIAQRSSTVLQACVYRASHLVASRWQYKSPITCFQSLGNKIINANFYGNTYGVTYFWMYVLHAVMAYPLCVWRGNTTCLDNCYFEKWPTFLLKSNLLSAKVYRDYDFSSSDYSVFTINKEPFYYMHLLTHYFKWKYNWTVLQCENYFISNI